MLFAQVREDPNVELYCLNNIQKDNVNIFCICSGGCTVLSLLSNKINKIDVLDFNIEQIYLCNLKKAVCCHFKNKTDILKFIQGEFSQTEYDEYIHKLNLPQNEITYWNKNIQHIYFGINRYGKFEELFRQLVDTDFDYKKIFDRQNLINIFGESAVINSNEKEFFDHFYGVIEIYKKLYVPSQNYFYNQILYDKYDVNNLPYYFNNINNICTNHSKINYICNDFIEYIHTCKDDTYDILHVSNLTDWMTNGNIEKLLMQIKKVLKKNGFIILRRLNGDYNLHSLVKKYFLIHENVPSDLSHFYSEVVVGQKIF